MSNPEGPQSERGYPDMVDLSKYLCLPVEKDIIFRLRDAARRDAYQDEEVVFGPARAMEKIGETPLTEREVRVLPGLFLQKAEQFVAQFPSLDRARFKAYVLGPLAANAEIVEEERGAFGTEEMDREMKFLSEMYRQLEVLLRESMDCGWAKGEELTEQRMRVAFSKNFESFISGLRVKIGMRKFVHEGCYGAAISALALEIGSNDILEGYMDTVIAIINFLIAKEAKELGVEEEVEMANIEKVLAEERMNIVRPRDFWDIGTNGLMDTTNRFLAFVVRKLREKIINNLLEDSGDRSTLAQRVMKLIEFPEDVN